MSKPQTTPIQAFEILYPSHEEQLSYIRKADACIRVCELISQWQHDVAFDEFTMKSVNAAKNALRGIRS